MWDAESAASIREPASYSAVSLWIQSVRSLAIFCNTGSNQSAISSLISGSTIVACETKIGTFLQPSLILFNLLQHSPNRLHFRVVSSCSCTPFLTLFNALYRFPTPVFLEGIGSVHKGLEKPPLPHSSAKQGPARLQVQRRCGIWMCFRLSTSHN